MPASRAEVLEVRDAPYTSPGPKQVVVKNGAVAVNAYDWALQYQGPVFASYLKYPMVIGTDIAGTVVEVGPEVTRFKVGDRVAGCAASIVKESANAAEGAFQLYCVARENLIAPVPDHITDEQASVLGLGVATATYGLFHKKYLGLDMPQVPPPANPQPGKKYPRAIIVTGGASSVGSCAIQLAASAGYKVLSTSSPRNFEYVKSLGASHVFDYNSTTLVDDLVRALAGHELVGAYTVGNNADRVCAAVIKERLSKTPELPTRKFISLAGGGGRNSDEMKGSIGTYRLVSGMVGMLGKNAVKKMVTGIEVSFILMADLVGPTSCVSQIYLNYLGPALAQRQFIPSPNPEVVGQGLHAINTALDICKKPQSAQKIVVKLS